MAQIKITALPAYADPASTDVLPIVDVGADVTKKVSVADLLKNAPAGTAAAPGIAFGGDNTGIYSPGADQLAISTNGTEAARIDSSGRLLVGTSTSVGSKQLIFQTAAEDALTIRVQSGSYPYNWINLDRQGISGAAVPSGAALGAITFRGWDGSNAVPGASIFAAVDGTPGANDMPGRLVFSVTADGASSPTEAMRITNDRYVRLASGSGGIQFNGDTATANALDDYEEGTWTPALNWTNVTYTTQQGKYTKIGNRVFFSIYLIWSANDASIFTSINLPFTSTSVNERATISVQDVALPGNFQYPAADIFANLVYVRYVGTAGAYSTNYAVAANDAGRIAITGNYSVA